MHNRRTEATSVLIGVFVWFVLFFTAVAAQGEEVPVPKVQNKPVICSDGKTLIEKIKKNKLTEQTLVGYVEGTTSNHVIGYFTDKENTQYALVEMSPRGIACIIAFGEVIDPANFEQKKNR